MSAVHRGRGGFYYKWAGDVLGVYLGNPDYPESEFILQLDKFYLENLVSTIHLAKEDVK